jgi:hypothetical protein
MSPTLQVQVWAIQALLADDKPRTFHEIEQHIGSNPERALNAMFDQGSVAKVQVDNVTFWTRTTRRRSQPHPTSRSRKTDS